MLTYFRFFVITLFLISTSTLANLIAIPEFKHRITDSATIIDEQSIAGLNQLLENLQTKTGYQVAVLTVKTTGDESIEEFATRVFEEWKLGDKNRDDGVLLLIASQDRTLRIEVGYGLESILADAQAGRIINKIIVPFFAKGEFSTGIIAGVNAIAMALDPSVEVTQQPEKGYTPNKLLSSVWVLSLVLFPTVVFSKKKSWLKYSLSALCSALISSALLVMSDPDKKGIHIDMLIYTFIFFLLYLIGYFIFHIIRGIFSGRVKVERSDEFKPPTRQRGSGSTRSSGSTGFSGSKSSGGSRGGGGSSGGGGASGRW